MSTLIPKNSASLTAWDVAAATGGDIVHLGRDTRAVGITTDTRSLKAGSAFVALRGNRFDGNEFQREAVQRGAVLLVVERGRTAHKDDAGVAVVEVDDTLVA